MKKLLQLKKGYSLFTPLLLLFPFILTSQVMIAPVDCYPQFNDVSEMDAAASLDGTTPFGTWVAAYNYASNNGATTIDFSPGLYEIQSTGSGNAGPTTGWGDADGGVSISVAGMTVNGNGATIDNSGNGSSQLAFATIAANNVTLDGFTFVEFTGNNAGAVLVDAGLTGWTISNCNFDHNDWAGDGLVVNQGAGSQGTIDGCNFYNHVQSTGSAMTVNGPGGQLDILNSTYSCNSRIVAGGAVRILGSANVDFDGCVFDGNLTNSASGGAISIEENSIVTMNNTNFTCNTAIVNVQDDGGAIHLIEGTSLTLTGCNFVDNQAQDKGGAIHVAGASASYVTLNISDTEFHSNDVITATTYGGAIYLNDFFADINNSYFFENNSAGTNSNGGGGALYISAGNSGSTIAFDNNTLLNNTSGNGVGNAIRTEMDIIGIGNSIAGDIYTACTSPGPGFYNFAGDDFDTGNTSNWTANGSTTITTSSGRMVIDASDNGSVYHNEQSSPTNTNCSYDVQLNNNTEKVTWTFCASNQSSLEGFDGSSEDGMAFVIGCTESDFFSPTAQGYAVIFDRNNGGQIELTSFTGGMSADVNYTPIAAGAGISSGGSSASVRVMYDPNTTEWTLAYDYNTNSSSDLDVDPRTDGGTCMSPEVTVTGNDATYASIILPYTGFAMSGSSQMTIDNYYTRVGNGCTNQMGWFGTPVPAVCGSCIVTPTVTNDCADEGSIQGYVFDDTETPDGMSDGNSGLAGVIVTLTGSDGSVVMVTTDATGLYYFGGLSNGVTYTVTFDVSNVTDANGDPYYPTYQNQPGATNTNDSDADESGNIPPITICVSCSSDLDDTDGTSGSSNYVSVDAGFSANPILPVTFGNIYIKNKDCMNVIEWTTESEINNDHFEIERSNDGRTFVTVATVDGKGTTSTTSTYIYKDGDQKNDGMTYYRIMQMDYDGQVAYSDIVTVMTEDCNDRTSKIHIYPSVFSDVINYEIDLKESTDLRLDVYNSIGKLVATKNIQNSNATILYESWNLSELQPGVYLVKASNANTVVKIIKQ